MLRTVAFLLCAAVTAALVLHPEWLQKGMDRKFLTQWVKGEYLRYDGTITVWHVASRACGTADGTNYLKQRAQEFEKKNFGIYVQLETLSQEELTQRLAAGARPDVLSFNGGDIENPQGILKELELTAELLPGLEEAGVYRGKRYACPIFQTGYAVVVNEDRFYETGISPPADLATMDAEWFSEWTGSAACDSEDLSTAGGAAFGALDQALQEALLTRPQTVDSFFAGEGAPIMLMSVLSARKFKLLGEKSYAPAHSTYGVSGFSGRVQYAGVCVSDNADKAEACACLIGTFLTKSSQAKLESIWAVPVADIGEKRPNDAMLAELWEAAMTGSHTVTPNAFAKVAYEKEYEAAETAQTLRTALLTYCNANGKRVK